MLQYLSALYRRGLTLKIAPLRSRRGYSISFFCSWRDITVIGQAIVDYRSDDSREAKRDGKYEQPAKVSVSVNYHAQVLFGRTGILPVTVIC